MTMRLASIAGFLALLALLLAQAPVPWLTAALLGLSLCVMIFIRPALGLLLLAFSIPFSTVGETTLAGAAVGPTEALLALTLAAWLAQRLAAGRLVLPRAWRRHEYRAASTVEAPVAPLLLPLLLFCAALAFSLLPAVSLRAAIPELLKWIETLALYLVAVDLLNESGAPAPTLRALISDRSSPIAPRAQESNRSSSIFTLQSSLYVGLVAALIAAGALQAALGLYQFVTQSGPPAFQILGRFLRAFGTFRQPNPYAGYLGMILPLALSLFWWAVGRLRVPGRDSRAYGPRRGLLWAVITGGMTAVIAAGAIASWSRGAWIGIAGGAAVVTALRSRRAFGLTLAAAALIAFLFVIRGGLIGGALGGRLAQIGEYLGGFDVTTVEVNDDNFAVVERVAHWVAAQRMIERAPWFGVGVGNYATVYPQVALPRWQDPLGHAHNMYLNTWAEAGLPGLLTYILLWLLAAWRAIRLARDRQASAFERAVALGVLGVIVHLTIHNLFDNLFVQRLYLHMALLLALLAPPTAARARHA
jgi:O-antigen ligase